MIIKEIKDEDLTLAQALYCSCFSKEIKNVSLSLSGSLLGLYLHHELIGMIQIDFINLLFENKRLAYFNSFCIKDTYQNQGYGAKLLEYSILFVKENGATVIQLTSNSTRLVAHRLYQKFGFQKMDTNFYQKII